MPSQDFPQSFSVKAKTDAKDKRGNILGQYDEIAVVDGILTRKKELSQINTQGLATYITKLNIRLDPVQVAEIEIKIGDMLIMQGYNPLNFTVVGVYPAFDPANMNQLIHIRCEVERTSTVQNSKMVTNGQ